jgi:hypothetical protein
MQQSYSKNPPALSVGGPTGSSFGAAVHDTNPSATDLCISERLISCYRPARNRSPASRRNQNSFLAGRQTPTEDHRSGGFGGSLYVTVYSRRPVTRFSMP